MMEAYTPDHPLPRPWAEPQPAKRRCLGPVRRSLLYSLVPETPCTLSPASPRKPENHNNGRATFSQGPTHLDWCARLGDRTVKCASMRSQSTRSRSMCCSHPSAFSCDDVLRPLCIACFNRSSEAHGRVARGLAARKLELLRGESTMLRPIGRSG